MKKLQRGGIVTATECVVFAASDCAAWLSLITLSFKYALERLAVIPVQEIHVSLRLLCNIHSHLKKNLVHIWINFNFFKHKRLNFP